MSGVKGKSGRKRISKNREEAMRSLTLSLPKAIDTIVETAEGSNKDRLRYEAAIEIKDSVMGKPKQVTDLDIKGGEGLGLTALKMLIEGMARRKIELEGPKLIEEGEADLWVEPLKEGEDAIQGQGNEVPASEGEEE